jgi:hypothetical protein
MRSAFPNLCQAPATPLRGTERAGKGESARLLPKDICDCQRSASPLDMEPTEKRPHITAGQRTSARRHKDRDLQPHGPSLPDTAGSPEGTTDRLGRSNRSATGSLTWRPRVPVSRPRWGIPEGSRLSADD